ncbi:hypothetical protein ACFL03_06540 [Thermodesulfobacteriota bacterium]
MVEIISMAAFKKLRVVERRIRWSNNRNDLLLSLVRNFTSSSRSQWLSIYVFDSINNDLVSIFNTYNVERRISLSFKRLCCYAFLNKKTMRGKNAYDEEELSSIVPELKLYKPRGKTALTSPIFSKNQVLGVVEAIFPEDSAFSWENEQIMKGLAKMLRSYLIHQDNIFFAYNKTKNIAVNMLLTPKQQTLAVKLALKLKKPIETILMNEFKIEKKDVGESLSRFYGFPYAEINQHTLVSGKLFMGLKPSVMRENVFMPIRFVKNEILLAVDNPFDLQKIQLIRSLFKGYRLKFVVALQQDILSYLGHFDQRDKFNEDKNTDDLINMDDILKLLEEEIEEE